LSRRTVRRLFARIRARGIRNRLARSLVLVANCSQTFGRETVSLCPCRAINISVTLRSGAIVSVNTLSGFSIARINSARFTIVTVLC
jgi:hypothetical protein